MRQQIVFQPLQAEWNAETRAKCRENFRVARSSQLTNKPLRTKLPTKSNTLLTHPRVGFDNRPWQAHGGHSNKAVTLLEYILVPSHFTKNLINTSFFETASRFHINKKERNFMLKNGLAEWLDRKNRILRRKQQCETAASWETGAGLLSRFGNDGLLDERVAWLMTEEMHA